MQNLQLKYKQCYFFFDRVWVTESALDDAIYIFNVFDYAL